jgi:hypothetical protein
MTITYVSIDGDNIGNKIAKSYFDNDETALLEIIQDLESSLACISEQLERAGFRTVFCAADGALYRGDVPDVDALLVRCIEVTKSSHTFSAGVGFDLRSSFFALKYAKAAGKAKLVMCDKGMKYRVTGFELLSTEAPRENERGFIILGE